MESWFITYMQLLTLYFLLNTVVGEDEICVDYKAVLPRGVCAKYLQHRKVAITKHKAVELDEKLEKFYETYIPLYTSYQNNVPVLKRLMNFYVGAECGQNEKITQLINSFSLPSGSVLRKCAVEIKQFICQIYYPICTPDSSGNMAIAHACREGCENALSTPSCSFFKPLESVIRELSHLCPKWSFNLRRSLQDASCSNYFPSNPPGKEYCLEKPKTLKSVPVGKPGKGSMTYQIPNRIKAMNVMEVVNSNQMEFKQPKQPFYNLAVSGEEAISCVEYKSVLPDGICSKYLQQKRIAQTKEKADEVNEGLKKFYETYIPLYVSYQTNQQLLKNLMKFYAKTACGKNDKITQLLDSLTLPSGTALKECSTDLKKFICEAAHPICMPDSSGKTSVALPCRDKCEKAWGTPSCSFMKPLISTLKEISKLCPAWSARIQTHLEKGNCQNFPASTVLGQEFCFKTQNRIATGYGVPTKELSYGTGHGIPTKELSYETGHGVPTKELSYGLKSGGEILMKPSTGFQQNTFKKSYEDTKECVAYDSISPSGICQEYLKGSYVAQSKEDIQQVDGHIGRTYMMLSTVLLGPDVEEVPMNPQLFWTWIWNKISPGCSNISKVNELKRKFTLKIDVNASRTCLDKNGWFYCHIFHPKCVYSKGKFQVSPVCRESCKRVWNDPSCTFISNLYQAYKEIKKYCVIPFNQHIESLFNCDALPSRDMKHIEKCQMQRNTTSIKTYSCYQGNGGSYRGDKNTAGASACQQWKSDPYLNRKMYPTLVGHYCRNPQGYGERPWCYVDMTSKNWSYCDIPKCTSVTKLGNRLTETYEKDGGTGTNVYDPPPLLVSFSYYKHSHTEKTSEKLNLSVGGIVILVAVVLVGVGCSTFICSYKRKRGSNIKEYRGIHQRPDINYVRVDPTDIN